MKPMPVHLDANHVDEVREIAELSFSRRWSRQDFAYFLAHPTAFCYGIKDSHQLSAYLIGLLVHGELDIISIATRPEARRRGYGEQLMQLAQRDSQVRTISLEVDVANEAAVALYTKLNFKKMGLRKAYYGGKDDAFRMLWMAAE
jgi:ribosomal-protein-alanine N-acetyltransferase